MTGKLRYRLLTGPDDKSFCERVSKAGSPAITYNGKHCIAAQAVILKVILNRAGPSGADNLLD